MKLPKKEKESLEHKTPLRGELANGTRFRILLPSRRHCNKLQPNQLLCFPRSRSAQLGAAAASRCASATALEILTHTHTPFLEQHQCPQLAAWGTLLLSSNGSNAKSKCGQSLMQSELAVTSCSFLMPRILRFTPPMAASGLWEVRNSD